MALDLLKNANVAAGGVLPMCQDTGTAIVLGKKDEGVLTGGGDEEAIARGVYDAYTRLTLRYSQLAPLTMWEERNTGTNLPAQIELYASEPHGEPAYSFLFMAKGGGSANKSFLYQETRAVLNPASMTRFLDEKLRALGTAACPPYHLAVVIGGTSAEHALKTAKLASAKYLDTLPTSGSPSGHGFRDLEMEAQVLALTQEFGIGAQFGGKYFCHDVRVVRLPRHGASFPVAIAVSCSADRQARGRITADGVFLEQLERDPARYLPDTTDEHLSDDVVRVDLNRPMDEIRAELTRYPVRTRLSLTGPLVVARDIAHAKIKERLDAGEPMPAYLRDMAVYYAGPAKTPAGVRVRVVRADHGRADGLLRRPVPGGRRLAGDAGEGQPVGGGDQRPAPSTAASTSARSAVPPPGSRRTASAAWRSWSTPSWAWRRSGGSRSRTSPRSSWSTTRATTSSPRSPGRSRSPSARARTDRRRPGHRATRGAGWSGAGDARGARRAAGPSWTAASRPPATTCARSSARTAG